MRFEILAPAGSQEALVAGIRCGANAVYLGGKSLNARRNAGNFNEKELLWAADYCHSHGAKLYMTVNTLCKNNELEEAYRLVNSAMSAGVDAFIVQDIGAAKMIRECFPQARLHASTQMSVMTPKGIEALKDMGFSRAVLPREMTAQEIREIKDSTDMELEIFVHGALCMSVSGQCFFSAMLGSRSGNRGLCAQPCRLSFSADKSGSFDLSLKDLSLIRHLKEIEELGVVSLKIEGRMKRPEYVAAAVNAIKKAINGEYFANDEIDLKSVFSRSGFTDGYFADKRGKTMFGTRQKEDVLAARDVLKDISHLYDNENPLIPISFNFRCRKNQPALLEACALGREICVQGAVPEEAVNRPMTEEGISQRLAKLGGTQFYAENISVELDDGLIIPASKINELRREAVALLSESSRASFEVRPFEMPKAISGGSGMYYTARFSDERQIPERHPFKRVFIPLWSSAEAFVDNRAGVEIPRGLFGKEKELERRLQYLKRIGVSKALCGNLGAYKIASDMGFEVFGDFGLNITNSVSANMINSPVLSFELTLDEIKEVAGEDCGIIAYGKLPLMLARNCPVKNNIGCAQCTGKGVLTDRKGVKFPVKCSPYPCVEVLNSVPLYMADRQREINCSFLHLYFTDESAGEIKKIISLYQNGQKADFEFTRGLYYRGVL